MFDRLILCDIAERMVRAWREAFAGAPRVTIVHGAIFETKSDAVLLPTNSFGFLEDGVARLAEEQFGARLGERLRALLAAEHDGELLVGQAVLVPTDDPRLRFVLAAPTARVPGVLPDGSVNAYLALYGALTIIRRHNAERPESAIERLAVPGLGTGQGRLPFARAAAQMRYAYDRATGCVPPPATLDTAIDTHRNLALA